MKEDNKMKLRKLKVDPIAMGIVDHDVLCWLCNKRPAVYDMNPTWVFRPCWKCQKEIKRGGKIIFRDNLNWFQRLFV